MCTMADPKRTPMRLAPYTTGAPFALRYEERALCTEPVDADEVLRVNEAIERLLHFDVSYDDLYRAPPAPTTEFCFGGQAYHDDGAAGAVDFFDGDGAALYLMEQEDAAADTGMPRWASEIDDAFRKFMQLKGSVDVDDGVPVVLPCGIELIPISKAPPPPPVEPPPQAPSPASSVPEAPSGVSSVAEAPSPASSVAEAPSSGEASSEPEEPMAHALRVRQTGEDALRTLMLVGWEQPEFVREALRVLIPHAYPDLLDHVRRVADNHPRDDERGALDALCEVCYEPIPLDSPLVWTAPCSARSLMCDRCFGAYRMEVCLLVCVCGKRVR